MQIPMGPLSQTAWRAYWELGGSTLFLQTDKWEHSRELVAWLKGQVGDLRDAQRFMDPTRDPQDFLALVHILPAKSGKMSLAEYAEQVERDLVEPFDAIIEGLSVPETIQRMRGVLQELWEYAGRKYELKHFQKWRCA